ncbi:MAG: response regulator transcription factor [Mycobacteriaceae bacterium]
MARQTGRAEHAGAYMTGARACGEPAAVRVLVADAQGVVRDGISLVVGLLDGIEVIGTVSDGAQAVAQAASLRPHVVLMDLHMPVLDGIQATRRIRADHPPTQVLILSTYAEDSDLLPALEAGALGYLTKDASAEDIRAAILDVAHGRTHLDPEIQQRLVADVVARHTPGRTDDMSGRTGPGGLTARESEVLRLISRGLSNTEIARALVLSNATVKTHINHIFAKTGVRDRGQAVRYAYEHGLDSQ